MMAEFIDVFSDAHEALSIINNDPGSMPKTNSATGNMAGGKRTVSLSGTIAGVTSGSVTVSAPGNNAFIVDLSVIPGFESVTVNSTTEITWGDLASNPLNLPPDSAFIFRWSWNCLGIRNWIRL